MPNDHRGLTHFHGLPLISLSTWPSHPPPPLEKPLVKSSREIKMQFSFCVCSCSWTLKSEFLLPPKYSSTLQKASFADSVNAAILFLMNNRWLPCSPRMSFKLLGLAFKALHHPVSTASLSRLISCHPSWPVSLPLPPLSVPQQIWSPLPGC